MQKDPTSQPWEWMRTRVDIEIYQKLRLLDFDDLFLLTCLGQGLTLAATAKQLSLTQPAITQRSRKIEKVFGRAIFQKAGRNVRLTKDGVDICRTAQEALETMTDSLSLQGGKTVRFGVLGSIDATTWLPSLEHLRETQPHVTVHVVQISEHIGRDLLYSGQLDALLTYRGHQYPQSEVVEIFTEEYFLVAAPRVAQKIQQLEDLKSLTLLDLEEDQSILDLFDLSSTPSLAFKDRWYLGSIRAVLQALLSERGVALLPEHIVHPICETGKLVTVLPESTHFTAMVSLISRADERLGDSVTKLAQALTERLARPQI